ncbi:MAG: hypothetical protein LDL56_00590 [Armatimonadetes bacterium]|nr:hypothetical protein [Armatimonadota bacterium]
MANRGPRHTKTAVLIDGDIIAYQASAGVEVSTDDGDRWTDFDGAARAVDVEIERIAEDVGADKIVVSLTDRENFRKEVYPDYKANRAGARKPLALSAARAHMQVSRKAIIKPRLEADDVIGILATHRDVLGDYRRVIASIDKDLRGIPGLVYNWRKRDEGVVEVTAAKANGMFLMQTLTGDPVDGYPGLPGVGPVKARAILQGRRFAAAWAAIVEAYEAKGLTAEDALTQARLARILRAEDYDFSRKEPILWKPPSL